jgi:hypothetical protein
VEVVPAGVQIGDDRFPGPVAVAVDDVAAITVREQLGVVSRVRRLFADPRTDAHLGGLVLTGSHGRIRYPAALGTQ